jgi:hypothetical protein
VALRSTEVSLWAWIAIALLAWLTLSTVVGLIAGAFLRRIACDGSVKPSADTRRPARLRLVRSRSFPAGS